MRALGQVFSDAFDDFQTPPGRSVSPEYLRCLLQSKEFIAFVALCKGQVIGGLTAYELRMFDEERSEIYLYDLAVMKSHRRKRVASRLIEALKDLAVARNAHAVYVQSDNTPADAAAIKLYRNFGKPRHVFHFDLQENGG